MRRNFKLEDAAKYPFYWRSGNRIEIESVLKTHSDGSFLIRSARDQSLCLSLKYHKVYHLKLVEDTDGIVKIGHGNQYPSIKYFMEELNTNRHSLKIIGTSQNSQAITLQFPVEPESKAEETYVTSPPSSIRRISESKVDKVYIKTSNAEKLADYQGFMKSEPKWNQRYFILEDNYLKWFHNDEKRGREKSVNVENINTVTLMSNYKKRGNVCMISTVDKEIYIAASELLLREWHDILTKNMSQINSKKGFAL